MTVSCLSARVVTARTTEMAILYIPSRGHQQTNTSHGLQSQTRKPSHITSHSGRDFGMIFSKIYIPSLL